MRKSINLLVGLFLFVLVFSFSGIRSSAAVRSFSSYKSLPGVESYFQYVNLLKDGSHNPMPSIDFSQIFDDSIPNAELYKVNISSSALVTTSKALGLPHFCIAARIGSTDYIFDNFDSFQTANSFSYNSTFDIYITRNVGLIQPYFFGMFDSIDYYYTTDITVSLDLSVNSIEPLSDSDIDQYEAGYNSGYSKGFSEGQSQGYSNGYSDGYSAGETSGYNTGYQAGVDSVDTQSFFDAGYSSGQAAGYASGYDTGYDKGYDDAMARVESWGADTSSYPKLIDSFDLNGYTGQITCSRDAADHEYTMIVQSTSNRSILSDHVYRLYGVLENFNASNSSVTWDQYDIYVNIGSEQYKVFSRPSNYAVDEDFFIDVFIPGYLMSSTFSIKVVFRNCFPRSTDAQIGTISVLHDGFDGTLVDYGPINNSQNETAKQTDDLTNGYDSSVGESASSTFEDNAASYEQAEANIFTSAKSDLNNFKFYDIGSDSSVLVGLSFVAATMTSIFGAMGGLSGGAGIVLSVLFSVMLVSIVIGTYRYFVSSGKTGSSGSKKGGKG